MPLTIKRIGKKFADRKIVKKLYKTAFPRNERMRFRALEKSADSAMVEWLAYYNDGKFVGFSYLSFDDAIAYLFYFAVHDESRSKGYGSEILADIKRRHADKIIVLDIEACGDAAKNREQRLRRRDFYFRNGFADAGFDSNYHGVHYDTLLYGGECSKARLMQLFKKYRREVLSERVKDK